jgi:hypothetical protein
LKRALKSASIRGPRRVGHRVARANIVQLVLLAVLPAIDQSVDRGHTLTSECPSYKRPQQQMPRVRPLLQQKVQVSFFFNEGCRPQTQQHPLHLRLWGAIAGRGSGASGSISLDVAACCRSTGERVPTPNMTPIEDAWMRRVVRFWNSLASLPMCHLFLLELGVVTVFLFGVTSRSPTWAGSVMKALGGIGYP